MWLIVASYTPRGLKEKEFSFPTDMSWNAFQRIVATYLGGGVTQLCCRIIGEDDRGCLIALREDDDWADLMADMCQGCAAGLYRELEVVKVR